MGFDEIAVNNAEPVNQYVKRLLSGPQSGISKAVGGTSRLAHETALRRMEQAGVQLTSVTQYICELQRDWSRKETVPIFFQGLLDNGSFFVETLKEK